jgi:pyrroline-5-carboxylate reductase
VAISERLGFLGFGNMGSAILRGLLDNGDAAASNVSVFDPSGERQSDAKALGVTVVDSAAALADGSDVFVLAVKPQQFAEAVEPALGSLNDSKLAVSIMAGVSIEAIAKTLGGVSRVARVMPNLPAIVGAGASGVAYSDACSDADRAIVRTMFEAVGVVEEVAESQLDAVTAVSGSGPAYFFHLVECMAAAGEAEGLDRAQAERLAKQAAYGAGLLMRESGESPGTLRERVTSKGGTTFAALESFRANDLPGVIASGVRAAAARSRELGR